MEEKYEQTEQKEKTDKVDQTEQAEKTKQLLEEYVSQFNEIERVAYNIAKNSLESSFDLEKSIGFITWRKEKR